MFKFGHPEFLYCLLAVVLFAGLFVLNGFLRKKNLRKFGQKSLVSLLMPDVARWRRNLKFILLMFAYISLIIALSDPEVGSKLDKVKRKGIELVIALDVSNSMMAEDVYPNRLEAAKMAVEKLVDKLSNDKIGLIIFAGDAFVQLPITADYVSAKMFLESISTTSISLQGTDISKAIETGIRSFSSESEKNKVLVIISDGENHEEGVNEMAAEAAKKGIIIHTIGMGQPQGAPIPVYGKFGKKDFKTDKQGTIIITKTNDALLQQIASAGGGVYVRATNLLTVLNEIFNRISKINQKEIESQMFSDYEHQYQYFIALSILLLLVEFMLIERKNRHFRNFNLFKKRVL
ncbi:MAG: hypothetical protein COX07_01265 [Bacteroidetes bacterium CG23_combo_of_CG06-09_8_20_14_all_32_9]|nr:MAG: hypothetical protein COX07_01265 [Bacteroidetes bacterium CG23_combo_of_CG06-09_8_20_14_all_32_9]